MPTEAIKCLPGIEIATEHAREQHILGYLIDCNAPSFRDFIKHLIALRHERAHNIIGHLKKRGIRISYEQIRSLSKNDYIGRPQIAGALVRMGCVGSIKEAFREYLSGDELRKVPRPKPTAEEGIAGIHAAGGVAVLAHPYSLGLRGPELEARLTYLKARGIDGVECHYGTYTREQTEACAGFAGRLGLIVTGGSDFHGPNVKPGIKIATGMDNMLDFNDMAAVRRLESAARAG
jgi:predicted metal-dependent phosphoesterase TrpH